MKTYLLISILVIFPGIWIKSQTSGCTDPVANNYNPSATMNDGSCTYTNATLNPNTKFNLPAALSESSGLIWWNGGIWMHNDSGNEPYLYEIDSITGNISRTVQITNATNIDWEDLGQDENYIYIGDFGNNAGNRTNLKIYRIAKTDVSNSDQVSASVISFSYADQTDLSSPGNNNTKFDCEAMIVYNDQLFLFTKDWVDNKTSLYMIPTSPGTYIATNLGTLDVQGLVTGATVIPERRTIALCGYSSLGLHFLYLLYDFAGNNLFGGNKRKVHLAGTPSQTEGIGWVNPDHIFISSETSIVSAAKVQSVDVDPLLNPYYQVLAVQFITLETRTNNNDVELRWNIEPIDDIELVEVQRRKDGDPNYLTIARLQPTQKEYLDLNILADGHSYFYRLKVTDKNNKVTLGPEKSVKEKQLSEVNLYIQFQQAIITLPDGEAGSFQVFGSDGKMHHYSKIAGGTSHILLSSLPRGYYIGRIIHQGKSRSIPFLLLP